MRRSVRLVLPETDLKASRGIESTVPVSMVCGDLGGLASSEDDLFI